MRRKSIIGTTHASDFMLIAVLLLLAYPIIMVGRVLPPLSNFTLFLYVLRTNEPRSPSVDVIVRTSSSTDSEVIRDLFTSQINTDTHKLTRNKTKRTRKHSQQPHGLT